MCWIIWALKGKGDTTMERKFVYNDITLKPDEDNNIVLLSKKSIAPLEVFQYGINSEGKYYLRWDYPLLGDYELETDYREITQERILEDLNNELIICERNGEMRVVENIMKAIHYIKNF